jgi:putative endonuclease
MKPRLFYVYIITNVLRSVLYIGMTNNLQRRLLEHFWKVHPNSFSARYNVSNLLYWETTPYVLNAIAREKELKSWSRARKMELIGTVNPELKFLSEEVFGCWPPKTRWG